MLTTRLLTKDDSQQILDILSTRDHMWKKEPFDVNIMKNFYESDYPYTNTMEVLGLFDNDILDGFQLLNYPPIPSIRADDQTKTDKCAITGFAATRKLPNRQKSEDGWDINYSKLKNDMIQRLWDKQCFTHWTLMPISYKAHKTDSNYTNLKNYIITTIESIPAGNMSIGINAAFIRQYVAGKPYAEDVDIRLSTLPDEFRTK